MLKKQKVYLSLMRKAVFILFMLTFGMAQAQTVLSPPDSTILPKDSLSEEISYTLQFQPLSKSGLPFSKILLQSPDTLIALRERRGHYVLMEASDPRLSMLPAEALQTHIYAEKEGFLSIFYLLKKEKEIIVRELLRNTEEGKSTDSLIHQLSPE